MQTIAQEKAMGEPEETIKKEVEENDEKNLIRATVELLKLVATQKSVAHRLRIVSADFAVRWAASTGEVGRNVSGGTEDLLNADRENVEAAGDFDEDNSEPNEFDIPF